VFLCFGQAAEDASGSSKVPCLSIGKLTSQRRRARQMTAALRFLPSARIRA
jgi:hypothetical protein